MDNGTPFKDLVIYFMFACRNVRVLRAIRVNVKLGRITDAVQRYLGNVLYQQHYYEHICMHFVVYLMNMPVVIDA